LKFVYRSDNVIAASTADLAIAKAQLAYDFRLTNTLGDTDPVASSLRPTGSLGNIDRARSWFNNQPYLNLGGGGAIFYNGAFIGAVGVSGGTTVQDDSDAQLLITKLLDALALSVSSLPSQLNLPEPAPQRAGTFSVWRANEIATVCISGASQRILNGDLVPVLSTIAIVDSYAKIKFLARMDDAPLSTVNVAIWKARTAATFGDAYRNLNDLNQLVASTKADYGLQYGDKGFLFLPGGIPISSTTLLPNVASYKIGSTIGGIGVSGNSKQSDDDGVASLGQYVLADLIIGHQNSAGHFTASILLILAAIVTVLFS